MAENLEDKFQVIDKLTESIKELEKAELESNRLPQQISQLRKTVRADARNLETAEAQDAVDQILSLTGTAGRSTITELRCFSYLRIVRENLEHRPRRDHFAHKFEIFRTLQRLIDISFLDRARQFSFDDCDRYEGRDGIRLTLSDLRQEEAEAWSKLSEALQQFCRDRRCLVDDDHWDFFIAHSASDKSIANRVFVELSKIGRVFLDTRCIKVGDRWPEKIRAAQDYSKSTVVIITEETPNSWFSESEYLHAINLGRSGVHIIIPVLFVKTPSCHMVLNRFKLLDC
jgi:hypothetical protein